MLLTPLGILRILNLSCACPGVGAGMRESSVPFVAGYAVSKHRPVLPILCYQVVLTGIASIMF